MSGAQQRMGVFGNSPLRGGDPESPTLEWVAGDAYLAAPFAGEQASEVHREACAVGPGHRAQKGIRPFRFGTIEGGAEHTLQHQGGIGNTGPGRPVPGRPVQ